MRRMLVALAVSAGVLVLPTSASAQVDLLEFQSAVDAMLAVDPTMEPPPSDGTRDFVVGGWQSGNLNSGLSAHSDPLGGDVWGFETNTNTVTGGKFRQRVTCLAVEGNLAAYGLVVTHARSNTFPPGTEFVELVRDSGLPGGAGDGWELFGFQAEDCAAFLVFAFTARPIENGNILVHDAQP